MKILKSKNFWLTLVGVNITSSMISAFAGSVEGVIVGVLSLISCYVVLYTIEKEES
tara:strand:- start:90 stop:257 length:168 start_codon:yes stop_codon:yes gene_type:complete